MGSLDRQMDSCRDRFLFIQTEQTEAPSVGKGSSVQRASVRAQAPCANKTDRQSLYTEMYFVCRYLLALHIDRGSRRRTLRAMESLCKPST